VKLTKREAIEAGDMFTVECPYVREVVSLPDEEGGHSELSWRPGVVFETIVTNWGETTRARAHGLGSVTYTVVSTHVLPAPFPARVFFTRRWRSPDGREFGKRRLITMTRAQFSRRLNGYKAAGAEDGFFVEDLDEAGRTALTESNR
jgi:hypothetical protein